MKKDFNKRDALYDRLKKKNLPLITIDNSWYEIFSYYDKPTVIKNLEKKEKDLILKRARLNDEINECHKEKKILMAKFIKNEKYGIGLVDNSEESDMLDEYSKTIDRLNVVMQKNAESLKKLDDTIDEINLQLVVESMLLLDDMLLSNEQRIDEINKYIAHAKSEIKNKISLKNDIKEKDKNIYSYMHNILGSDIMQEFDGVTEYKIKRIRNKKVRDHKKNNEKNT